MFELTKKRQFNWSQIVYYKNRDMRKTLVFLIVGLLFSVSLRGQDLKSVLTSKLISGCPAEIKTISDQFGLSNLSYSNLNTGIDTLKILFGELTQGETRGYWISLFSNNKLLTFTTVQLSKKESSDFPTNIVDIKYDNSSRKISVQLTHNTLTDEIEYLWTSNNQKSEIAVIEKIEKPIQKGLMFPQMKLKTLYRDSILTSDLIGKYIVINWWATTCAPCRQEIPGLNTLVEKYRNNSDIVFLAVAFDKKSDLEYFLGLKKFKYIQTLGDKEISALFGESFPKNIIVNPQGITIFYSEGGHENKYLEIDEELKRQIDKK